VSVLYDVPGPQAKRRSLIGSTIGTAVLVAITVAVVLRLQSQGQFEASKWEPFQDEDILRALGKGALATLRAAGLAIALALVLGSLLAVGRLAGQRYVRMVATGVIELFRALPLVLLILFFFFRFGDTLGRYGALVAALALYNGAVLAEVFRAGILAVPRGQSEAAAALGLSRAQTMRLVLVPQAVRTMLPAIVAQCVVALKDTALGFIIAYPELLRTGQLIYNGFFNIIPTAIVVAAMYVSMNLLLSRLAIWLERRQSRVRPVIGLDAAEAPPVRL
jgi:glutamate transport system permease protein